MRTLCEPIREGNVVIVMDRFFTSVNLLQTLDYACLGTVMSNRKNLPDVTGKLARGQSIAKCTNDGIIFYKWQDTKEVIEFTYSVFCKHSRARRVLYFLVFS